jgi:ABC-type transport system involved in multi-copper enzyme maturation permease subunit
MNKNSSIVEMFTMTLNEDYRFPIPEVFAFLYAFGTFVLSNPVSISYARTGEHLAYDFASSINGLPMFFFTIFLFKNISYGIGYDLERGIAQTFFSYPLRRRQILTIKLVSALGLATALLLGVHVFSLLILVPDVLRKYFFTVVLTYVVDLCFPFLLSGFLLLVVLVSKKSGLSLAAGIGAYFLFSMLIIPIMLSSSPESNLGLKVYSVFNPSIALHMYYNQSKSRVWIPSFSEVLLYVAMGYFLVALIFIVGYAYFQKRLEL